MGKVAFSRLAALAAAGLLAGAGLCGAASAQQQTDEPKLDPIFGDKYEDDRDEAVPEGEDGEQRGVTRLRGFTSILTFLAPENTNLSVGVGPEYKPDYFGSDDYQLNPDPAAYIRVRNFEFFDDDGADLALLGFSRFRFGPSIRIVGNRNEDENPALEGLGDIGTTFEFGGFAAANFRNTYSVRFKVRHGLKTGHRGTIVDASATALLFRLGRVSTSVSAQSSWIGNKYADAYFTVDAEQSAASGLPEYDAQAGFRDIGGSFNGYINIGKKWSINPYVNYRYIFNEFADTPIIALEGTRHQWTTGFHLMREFSFNLK